MHNYKYYVKDVLLKNQRIIEFIFIYNNIYKYYMSYRNSKILDYQNKKIYYVSFEKKNNIVIKVNIRVEKMMNTDDIKLYKDPNEYQREYMKEKYKDPIFNNIRKEKYKSSPYIFCENCKCNVKHYNRKSHYKSKKHLKSIKDYNDITNL